MDQWLDWSAFGFLALLTLLDGLRRVPAGALVLRKTIGGAWTVIDLREGYGLVSWWPPLTTSLVIADPGETPTAQSGAAIGEQLAATRSRAATLMVLGGISLLALVVVVPLAMRWLGGMGFLLSLLVVVLLSCLIAVLVFFFSRSLGLSTRQRIFFALPRLNPFAAPAGGEALLERTLAGANPYAVARALMTESDFLAWIRPTAYDRLAGDASAGTALAEVIPPKELEKMIEARPAAVGAGSPWCPRCGSEFGTSSTECPACEVILKVS